MRTALNRNRKKKTKLQTKKHKEDILLGVKVKQFCTCDCDGKMLFIIINYVTFSALPPRRMKPIFPRRRVKNWKTQVMWYIPLP